MINLPKQKIIPTVGVLIIRDNRVLLVKHGALARVAAGIYGLPAGRREKHETEVETARRELKEETGLTAGLNNLIEYPNNNYVGKIKTKDGQVNIYPYKIFVCVHYDGKLKTIRVTAPEWIKIADIKKIKLHPNVAKIINDSLKFLKKYNNTKLDKKIETIIKQIPAKKYLSSSCP